MRLGMLGEECGGGWMRNLTCVLLCAQISAGDNDNPTSMVDKFEKGFKRSNVYYEVREE